MKKVWCGHMPGICGYGIRVYAKNKEEALKFLKSEFYGFRKAYDWKNSLECQSFYTFDKAMEYFSGSVFEIKFGENYFD